MTTPYAGDPSAFPLALTLPTDSDAPNAANLTTPDKGNADRTAWLRARVIGAAIANFKPPITTINAAGPVAVNLQHATYSPELQRWCGLFFPGSSGQLYAFATHDGGTTWTQIMATGPVGVAAIAGASYNGNSVFVVRESGGATDIVIVESSAAFLQTTQPFLGTLQQAILLAVPFPSLPTIFLLVGFQQSGGTYTGKSGQASSLAITGVWTDTSTTLPAQWQTGTNHVGCVVADANVAFTSTYLVLVAMGGVTAGTDSSRLMGISSVGPTDITPSFMVAGLIVTGLAFNPVTSTWGILCYDTLGAYLYTSTDQVTWTLTHTFLAASGSSLRVKKTGGLVVADALWVAQVGLVDSFASPEAESDRVLISSDGVSWTSAAYAMGGDSTAGIATFPMLRTNGAGLLAWNNLNHAFSHQASSLAGGWW